MSDSVIWHDLECGRYERDLPLWLDLAATYAGGAGGAILDVGAGTGRISLALARAGYRVVALDRDAELLAELARRAGPLPVEPVLGDARDFDLRGSPFDLCIVPMQTLQLLGGEHGRLGFMRSAARHLAAGGAVAVAIAGAEDFEEFEWHEGDAYPLPDMLETGGCLYSSQPTAVRRDGATFVLERRRDVVDRAGARRHDADRIALDVVTAREVEAAGQRAGLKPLAIREIPPTGEHIGSEVVILGAEQPVLRVCALYPTLMNIYADRGNLLMLEQRCRWRGIGFELTGSGIGDELDPGSADLFYVGGGQDRDQALCAADLHALKREPLTAAAARGAVILGVCGGYQLLGHDYQLADRTLPGVGLLDLRTVRAEGPRLIGNIAIEVDLPGAGRQILAGFENHGGRTHLAAGAAALGRVVRGHGNNGKDAQEGAIAGNVIGTYLHGPLLPKNSWFADWLIATALGADGPLAPLDDSLEDAAHADACKAAGL